VKGLGNLVDALARHELAAWVAEQHWRCGAT